MKENGNNIRTLKHLANPTHQLPLDCSGWLSSQSQFFLCCIFRARSRKAIPWNFPPEARNRLESSFYQFSYSVVHFPFISDLSALWKFADGILIKFEQQIYKVYEPNYFLRFG